MTRLTEAVLRGDVAFIRETAARALAGDMIALRACLHQIYKPLREKRVPLAQTLMAPEIPPPMQ